MTLPSAPDPFPFTRDPWHEKAIVLFFVVAPIVLTAYAVALLWGTGVHALDLTLLVAGWAVLGLGISVGFHRMLTHRSFEARAPARAVLLVLGSMALQGGAADWAATHIRHHAKADKEGDPHSPIEGLLHAHLGWLLRDRFVRSGTVYDRLMEDPVVRWVTRLFPLWAALSLALPFAIGGLVTGTWEGAWSGLLWGGFVRVFLSHHLTWSVNSVGHFLGTRTFPTDDRSRNNGILALFGFGEGWHNNHHAFPKAAFLGMRWWQVDPGKWVIWTLARLRLVYNVWNPTRQERLARAARRAT